jgi:cyclohexa-1,5-dienecarbonyl-CoA hydratase
MIVDRGTVRVEFSGQQVNVSWDRPPVQVFDRDLLEQLAHVLASDRVRSAHAVVLRGANHRWSAGFSVEDHFRERIRPMFQAFHEALRALWEVPVPTLAVVEGPCLGGGLELLWAADLAVAADTATFGQPEIRLGVFPPLAAVVDGQTLGAKRASDLMYLGEALTATQAREFGLVSRVLPQEAVDAEVERIVSTLIGLRRETLVLLKRTVRAQETPPWARLEEAERMYLDELMALPQAEEGLSAFLEKRAPVWANR